MLDWVMIPTPVVVALKELKGVTAPTAPEKVMFPPPVELSVKVLAPLMVEE